MTKTITLDQIPADKRKDYKETQQFVNAAHVTGTLRFVDLVDDDTVLCIDDDTDESYEVSACAICVTPA